jgi:hypothetical protein
MKIAVQTNSRQEVKCWMICRSFYLQLLVNSAHKRLFLILTLTHAAWSVWYKNSLKWEWYPQNLLSLLAKHPGTNITIPDSWNWSNYLGMTKWSDYMNNGPLRNFSHSKTICYIMWLILSEKTHFLVTI